MPAGALTAELPPMPAAAAAVPSDRPFAPESVIWKVSRERIILLYGPAAAIMQVAHPRIAAGVFEYSAFESAPLARLRGTLQTVWAIVFGSADEASAAADAVARRHARVRGDAAALGVRGPPRYSADEPDLLLWVVATLVMASIDGYRNCVGPLSDPECARFYLEMRRFGTYFGLNEAYGPQSWPQFADYWQRMIADPTIGSHPLSRRVAAAVARPRRPWWLAIGMCPLQFVIRQTIVAPVAQRLGMAPGRRSAAAMRVVHAACRALVPFLPRRLRFPPHYRHALREIGYTMPGKIE
jgi:uncharacterized protein (DUF2236 family)